MIFKLFILITCLCAVVTILRYWRLYRNKFRQYIEPELSRHGYTLITIRTAPLFSVGPFPKIEIRVGAPQTRTPFGSGEYTQYRIVQAKDDQGRPVTLWFKLYFECFRLKEIEFKKHS